VPWLEISGHEQAYGRPPLVLEEFRAPVRLTRDVRSCSAGKCPAALRGFRMFRQAAPPLYLRHHVRTTNPVAEHIASPFDFQLAASPWEGPVRGPRCDLARGP
jgi:hypothetical protein